jgi:hypothetical protein
MYYTEHYIQCSHYFLKSHYDYDGQKKIAGLDFLTHTPVFRRAHSFAYEPYHNIFSLFNFKLLSAPSFKANDCPSTTPQTDSPL